MRWGSRTPASTSTPSSGHRSGLPGGCSRATARVAPPNQLPPWASPVRRRRSRTARGSTGRFRMQPAPPGSRAALVCDAVAARSPGLRTHRAARRSRTNAACHPFGLRPCQDRRRCWSAPLATCSSTSWSRSIVISSAVMTCLHGRASARAVRRRTSRRGPPSWVRGHGSSECGRTTTAAGSRQRRSTHAAWSSSAR